MAEPGIASCRRHLGAPGHRRLALHGPTHPAQATNASSGAERGSARARPLVPKRPRHIWFLDFSRVGSVLRSVHVGTVVDGFSRKVLAIAVAPHEPSARFAVTLLRKALRTYGPPTWIVTDQGTQFTARLFMHVLRAHGIRRRYGAVGRKGSISIIERFWRSCKTEHTRGLNLFRPLSSTRARLRAYATWFNAHRPHQGLGQRTPDEVFTGRSRSPVSVPLRARLDVEHLDGNRDLPMLRLRRAA